MQEEQREEERCQRDDEERRETRQQRRKRWQERDERAEREEEEEREEERELEEARRRQVDYLVLQQQQQEEEEAVAATMAWVAALQEVAPETRAPAMERKRLDWDDHAETSTADKSFRRKYRMEEPAFNKLVEILRPAMERDQKFARECCRTYVYVPT